MPAMRYEQEICLRPGATVSVERPRRPDEHPVASGEAIERLLHGVRDHLGLDVAFVGEVVGGQRVFRYVNSKTETPIAVGDAAPVEETFCHAILAGDVPPVVRDPAEYPAVAGLEVVQELSIGSYLGVPIEFKDGRIYGTLCAFAHGIREDVSAEGVRLLRLVADLAAGYLEDIDAVETKRRLRQEGIEAVLADPDGMTLVYQPLRDLSTMQLVGVEALARFRQYEHGPARFFTEAAQAGLGAAAEMRAVRLAIDSLHQIPEPIRLNVNVAAETLCTDEFFDALAHVPPDRMVVEVTEHSTIEDYGQMKSASERLSRAGVWLAVDDVGMGFSGLNRILEVQPEELKLDASVIRNVDTNPVKQALVSAFCSFGARTEVGIVAEGIETDTELTALRVLGTKIGQGYHLGRPGQLDDVLG